MGQNPGFIHPFLTVTYQNIFTSHRFYTLGCPVRSKCPKVSAFLRIFPINPLYPDFPTILCCLCVCCLKQISLGIENSKFCLSGILVHRFPYLACQITSPQADWCQCINSIHFFWYIKPFQICKNILHSVKSPNHFISVPFHVHNHLL